MYVESCHYAKGEFQSLRASLRDRLQMVSATLKVLQQTATCRQAKLSYKSIVFVIHGTIQPGPSYLSLTIRYCEYFF